MKTTTLTTQLIAKGSTSSSSVTPQKSVFKTATEWNNFIASYHPTAPNSMLQTNIDFNQDMVIAVVDEYFGNGGHSIDIISVTENPQNIIVDVDQLLTGNATTVLCQPFHIVKVQKSVKPVIFQ